MKSLSFVTCFVLISGTFAFGQGGGMPPPVEEVLFVCAKVEDGFPCDRGKLLTCNETNCTRTQIGWEDITTPDGKEGLIQRPVLEWICGGEAESVIVVRDYDRFLKVSKCVRTEERPAAKYGSISSRNTDTPCYYECECAGCSDGPTTFQLENRPKPGSGFSGNAGWSTYVQKRCNEFATGNDPDVFGAYEICSTPLGNCEDPPPPNSGNPPPVVIDVP